MNFHTKILFIFFFCLFSTKNFYAQNTKKPKLIIGIVVEEMRYDYISRFWNKFEKGGFKRLVNEGISFQNHYIDYFFTYSSSGYATISTGTTPSQHGIISDSWYDRLHDKRIDCVSDENFSPTGTAANIGQKSAMNLITSTFGDELKKFSFNESKVIAIGLKDFSAVLSAGHSANAAYWFEDNTGNWVSSGYYLNNLPSWVKEFNEKKFQDIYVSREWNTLFPVEQYRESLPDATSYEFGMGERNTFPYSLTELKNRTRDYRYLKSTPFGNTYTKDFALAAIINENLGKDSITDFLSVNFCATSYIGNWFNSHSVEIEDAYLRLDNDLSHFLTFIDEQFGKENVLIYLTSDKGVDEHPEYSKAMRMPSGFVSAKTITFMLKSYLKALYGNGDLVKTYVDQQIYLNQVLAERLKISWSEMQLQSSQFVSQIQGIHWAGTSIAFQSSGFSEGIMRKMQNSFHQYRSGDILINLSPNWAVKDGDNEKIYSIAAAYEPFTHIPLIFYGWNLSHKKVFRKTVSHSVAGTLSLILEIPAPNAASGEVIQEIIIP